MENKNGMKGKMFSFTYILAAPSTPSNVTLRVVPSNTSACFEASWALPVSNGGDTTPITYLYLFLYLCFSSFSFKKLYFR